MTDRLIKVLEQKKLITRGLSRSGEIALIEHDDDTTLDYTFDWSSWLGTDTIASAVVDATGPTAVIKSQTATIIVLTISGTGGRIELRPTTTTSGETPELLIVVNSPARRDDYFPADRSIFGGF